MAASTVALVLVVFAACSVEMVEALTIVVAVGVTRGWRSAVEGAFAAIGVLGVLVAAVGVPVVRYVPISALRVIVGSLLLVMGESWLQKAILRGSGHKAPHDEDEIFARTRSDLQGAGGVRRRDPVGFAVACKGVFLEGVEVAVIVVSLGGSQHRLGLAAAAAGAAMLIVGGIGLVVARQLTEVPENVIKGGVGVMLTSLGLFWLGEGAGLHWPGGDSTIPVLIGAFLALTLAVTAALRVEPPARAASGPGSES